MNLKVLLPSEIFLEREVSKITAEAENGVFCLLPRHVDFTAALVPGLLSFTGMDGEEVFLGVDEGILVKVGSEVLVSVRDAVLGPNLGTLRRTIEERWHVVDERERLMRSSAARLEASLVRRFLELEKYGL
jgi:F-type H+-transporting ATPase subunit epsilon